MNLQVKKASKQMVKKASKQQGEENIKMEMVTKNAIVQFAHLVVSTEMVAKTFHQAGGH
jgi:hypothetical protein